MNSSCLFKKKELCFNAKLIPRAFRVASRNLINEKEIEVGLNDISKNRLKRAYLACLLETYRWGKLGTSIDVNEIPDEPRYDVLYDCTNCLLDNDLIAETFPVMSRRRKIAMATLADKLNNLLKANIRYNGLKL